MTAAKPGDQVTVSYIGTLENGHIFDQTAEDQPLVFTIGADEVFAALEEQIVGMTAGQVKNILIPTEQAYGPWREENLLELPRSSFPAGREIRVGEKLQIDFADGQARVMRVNAVDDEQVTLDGNHALAGCDLTFALRLDRIG
jgi:FKBP-type peptidyl-prolyl cis-trans isomerase 2